MAAAAAASDSFMAEEMRRRLGALHQHHAFNPLVLPPHPSSGLTDGDSEPDSSCSESGAGSSSNLTPFKPTPTSAATIPSVSPSATPERSPSAPGTSG